MKSLLIPITAVLGLTVAGAAMTLGRRTQVPRVYSTTFPSGPPPEAEVVTQINSAFDRKDYATAERLVNGVLGSSDPHLAVFRNGALLHTLHAQLIGYRGEDAEAVTETVRLLQGKYGLHRPNPVDLEAPLEAALRLGRTADADVIASWINENDLYLFTSFPALNKPAILSTPARRLAYAYLLFGHHASGGMKPDVSARYAERAYKLAPDDVPVIYQLADAYYGRDRDGDDDRAKALLDRAYALLPAGSGARRDLRNEAFTSLRIDPAGPDARATLNADIDASDREMEARNEADRAAKEAARLQFDRDHNPPRP